MGKFLVIIKTSHVLKWLKNELKMGHNFEYQIYFQKNKLFLDAKAAPISNNIC